MTVETKTLVAREFKEGDIPELVKEMSPTPEDLFLLSSSLPFPVTEEVFLERFQERNPEEHVFYSVTFQNESKPIGHFEINNISKRHESASAIHILLYKDYRGTGLGLELMQLISQVAFETLELYRLGLNVHTTNAQAIQVYKNAGYSVEGLIRDVLEFDGNRYSLYQMSLLRPEYLEKKSS